MLHNTVNATVVHGGVKTNVIPSEISLELDGRIVPGSTYDELVGELRGRTDSGNCTRFRN